MNENIFFVVKDDEGVLRPMAGIWRDNAAGEDSARRYEAKNPGVQIVRVNLTEV